MQLPFAIATVIALLPVLNAAAHALDADVFERAVPTTTCPYTSTVTYYDFTEILFTTTTTTATATRSVPCLDITSVDHGTTARWSTRTATVTSTVTALAQGTPK